jgi:spore germination protein YaaH
MSADKAAPVSPMGGSGLHAGYDIKTMIKDYLSYVPPQKLILGVPYYGFNWAKGEERIIEEIEENPNEHDDNPKDENEDDDEDKKVEIIKDSITQTYSEIITNIEELNAEVQWDEPGQVPFYEYVDEETQKTRKVYFENEKSLSVKYQIAKEFDLAGVGIWALGYDGDRPELWKLLDTEFNLK